MSPHTTQARPGEFLFIPPGDKEAIGDGTETVIPGDEAIILEIFNGEGHGEKIRAAVSESKRHENKLDAIK